MIAFIFAFGVFFVALIRHELKTPRGERWWWPEPRLAHGKGIRATSGEIDLHALHALPAAEKVPEPEPDPIEIGDDDRGRLIRLILDNLDRDYAENYPTAFMMHIDEVYRLEGTGARSLLLDLRLLRNEAVRYVDLLFKITGPDKSARLVRAIENDIRYLRWFELTAEARKDLDDGKIMQRVRAAASSLTHGGSSAIMADLARAKLDLENINTIIEKLGRARRWDAMNARIRDRDKLTERYNAIASKIRSGKFDPYRVPRARSVDQVVVYLATYRTAVALRCGARVIDDNEIMRRIVDLTPEATAR